jgi:hypothetical protein
MCLNANPACKNGDRVSRLVNGMNFGSTSLYIKNSQFDISIYKELSIQSKTMSDRSEEAQQKCLLHVRSYLGTKYQERISVSLQRTISKSNAIPDHNEEAQQKSSLYRYVRSYLGTKYQESTSVSLQRTISLK